MALVLGTNCGIVTTSPSADPGGDLGVSQMDTFKRAIKITTSSAINIDEIGWWLSSESTDNGGNYEVGIYDHDSGNNRPGNRLQVSTGHTTSGYGAWQKVTGLNWSLDASTTYWIAVQCDNVTGTINIDRGTLSGERYVATNSSTDLPASWGVPSVANDNQILAIYALQLEQVNVSVSTQTLSLTQETITTSGTDKNITPTTQSLSLTQQTPTYQAVELTRAESSSIYFQNGTILAATLSATTTSNTLGYYLTADGGTNWELVSNNVKHNFTNTGDDLRWRIINTATPSVSNVTKVIVYAYK